MLRTRRPSSVALPSPKSQKAKVLSELPVYTVFLERSRSDETETSSSSSLEDPLEQVFSNKIKDTFPLCRKNPHKEIIERRRRWLLRTLLLVSALLLVQLNLPFRTKSKRTENTGTRETVPGRQLTSETESARSLDSLISQSKIRQEAEANVLRHFGDGPHLVEFELRVWDDDNRPTKHYFTIELAPTVSAFECCDHKSQTCRFAALDAHFCLLLS